MTRTRRVLQVEILQGQYRLWILFRSELDVENGGRGNIYHVPTMSSLARLVRVANNYPVKLSLDGRTPVITVVRQRHPDPWFQEVEF